LLNLNKTRTMSNNEKNTNDSFSRGVFLIIIGAIALLITFFDFDVDWHIVGKMWPVLLIIIGVCLMPINKWLRTLLAVALFALGYWAYENKYDSIVIMDDDTEIISSYSGDDD